MRARLSRLCNPLLATGGGLCLLALRAKPGVLQALWQVAPSYLTASVCGARGGPADARGPRQGAGRSGRGGHHQQGGTKATRRQHGQGSGGSGEADSTRGGSQVSGLGRPAGEWRHSLVAKLIKAHYKPSQGLAAMGAASRAKTIHGPAACLQC